MPKDTSIQSVLIIGSGPIIIGQACEFDYSGSQAALSLKEEGISVSIINSNPATIMTDKVIADHVYLLPLNCESLEQILIEQKIDAVLPTMGGQTALNLCIEADEQGLWKKYGVKVIGVDVAAIEKTENREEFRKLMVEIGIGVAKSKIANSPQHFNGLVTHVLVTTIAQRHGRSHRNRITSMNAHRVEILDGANNNYIVFIIAKQFELIFFPAQHGLLYQYFVGGRCL